MSIKISEKELYKQLKSYLGKEEFENTIKKYKDYLDKVFNKSAKRFKITEVTKTVKPTTAQIPQLQGPGGTFIPYPEQYMRKVYNKKTVTSNNPNDLAKMGINFILAEFQGGTRKKSKYDFCISAKKKLFYKFIESEFMGELIPQINLNKNLNEIKDKIKNIEVSKRRVVSLAALLTTLGIGTSFMGFFDQPGIAGLKPEVIISTVPLYSVQMIERAKSDRKLKNRAIGDVFLAHQKGNKDVLRLDATLDGPWRFLYLAYLVQLQKEGEAKTKNVSLTPTTEVIVKEATAGTFVGETADKRILNYDVHKTFPIITRTAILFNMYLQTIEWHQSVEDGKGVIKVHLLFRKYFPTTAFKVFNPIWDDESNLIIGGTSLEVGENYGMAKRWLEFTVDAIWKMGKMHGEMYGRMLIGDDGQARHVIDRQAVSSVEKLVTSYSGKLLGII